jgi:hypothetical protein
MDAETAAAYLLTHFTVPLLAVVGVIVGVVVVRRVSARRLARVGPGASAVRPAAPRPDTRTRVAPATSPACDERGHDLVVEHDRRTGLPATIRCARPDCRFVASAQLDPQRLSGSRLTG